MLELLEPTIRIFDERIEPEPEPQPEVSDRTLYRVRHWYEYGRDFEWSRPEINRLEPFHAYDMDEAWQWYWFDSLMFSKYGMTDRSLLTDEQIEYLKKGFAITNPHLAFTNKSFYGVNYITGEQGDGSMNTADTIVCGGNFLAGTKVRLDGVSGYVNGWYLEVETLDATKPPPSIAEVNHKTHRWLWNQAIIATKTPLSDGSLKCTNFPQMDYTPIYVPIASKYVWSKHPVYFPFGAMIETEDGKKWANFLEEIPAGLPLPPSTNVERT